MGLFVLYMTLNLFTSLWLLTIAKENELISLGLELSANSSALPSITILKATSGALTERFGCRERQLRKWSLINALTRAFICTAHTESVGVGLVSQAFVKHPIAITAAVERLLADVFFLGFFSWWQIDGGCITTQHWKILVAQIFVLVLKKKHKNINLT